MRNEDTGQRAKEYHHLRSKQRNKDERDNVGVGSGRGRKVYDVMEAKEKEYREWKTQNVKSVSSGITSDFVFFLITFLNFPRILNRHVFCYSSENSFLWKTA